MASYCNRLCQGFGFDCEFRTQDGYCVFADSVKFEGNTIITKLPTNKQTNNSGVSAKDLAITIRNFVEDLMSTQGE